MPANEMSPFVNRTDSSVVLEAEITVGVVSRVPQPAARETNTAVHTQRNRSAQGDDVFSPRLVITLTTLVDDEFVQRMRTSALLSSVKKVE